MSQQDAPVHNQAHRMTRHLDDPPKFLFWELDQALVVICMLGAAIILQFPGGPLTGLAIGVGIAWAIGKAKGGRGRGVSKHLAYWHLGAQIGMKCTPPSFVRRFFG